MGTHTDTTHVYTIREAAKLSGLPESTLRYYETIGVIEPIHRDASSRHRAYSEGDIDRIVSVACLYATGMSINDMRTYLANASHGEEASMEQVQLLTAQKHRLAEEARYVKLRLQYVELKIAYWQAVAAGDAKQVAAISEKAKALASDLAPAKEK